MQIYDLLIDDHQRIKSLLESLISMESDSFDLREGLLNQIKSEFIPHARAEESVLYDSIRNIEGIKEMALESYEEHLEVETLLNSLMTRTSFDPSWQQSAKELKQAIEDHIYHEENEMFTIARNIFSQVEAENMGKNFDQQKQELQVPWKEAG